MLFNSLYMLLPFLFGFILVYSILSLTLGDEGVQVSSNQVAPTSKKVHPLFKLKVPDKVFLMSFAQPITKQGCRSLGTALKQGYTPVISTGKLFNITKDGTKSVDVLNELKTFKPKVIMSTIESDLVGEEDLIIVADFFDVLYLQNHKTFIEKFLEFENKGKRVVFGAEMHYHPFYPGEYDCYNLKPEKVFELFDNLFGKDRKVRNLNSGFFAGRKKYMRDFVVSWNWRRRIASDGKWCKDDQGLASQVLLQNSLWMGLDSNNSLVINTFKVDVKDLEFSKSGGGAYLFDKRTNSFPCTVHFNGDAWQEGQGVKQKWVFEEYFKEYPFKLLDNLQFHLDGQPVTFHHACSSFDLKTY